MDLYVVTENFQYKDKFGNSSQIRRAALSITSNIAEGHGRSSNQDFARFLFMAMGSIREIESILEVSKALELSDDISEPINNL